MQNCYSRLLWPIGVADTQLLHSTFHVSSVRKKLSVQNTFKYYFHQPLFDNVIKTALTLLVSTYFE
jgi:hypothetical protein